MSLPPSGEPEGILSGRRKSAVLLKILGADVAAQVVKLLREDLQEPLMREVALLGRVPPEIQERVIEDAHSEILRLDESGPDFAEKVLSKAFGDKRAATVLRKSRNSSQYFSVFRDHDPSHVVQFLENELPQTVAAILIHLSPRSAAQYYAQLSEPMRNEVAMRILDMGTFSPEAIAELETAVREYLKDFSTREAEVSGGTKPLVSMIRFLGNRNIEQQVLDFLRDNRPDVYAQVEAKLFRFENIAQLDDKDMLQVVAEISKEDLALALTSAPEAIQNKFNAAMSKRRQAEIRELIDTMPRQKPGAVEEAQQRIVSAIRQMEDEGKITIILEEDENAAV